MKWPSQAVAEANNSQALELAMITAEKEKTVACAGMISKMAEKQTFIDSAAVREAGCNRERAPNKHDVAITRTKERHATTRSVVSTVAAPAALVIGAGKLLGAAGDRINSGGGDIKFNKKSVVDSKAGRDLVQGDQKINRSVVEATAGSDLVGDDKKTTSITTTTSDTNSQSTDTGSNTQ